MTHNTDTTTATLVIIILICSIASSAATMLLWAKVSNTEDRIQRLEIIESTELF